jgi:hypothetical protein
MSFIFSILLLPILSTIFNSRVQDKPVIQASESTVNETTTNECAQLAYDNCAFYASCLESRYNCGPFGYPIGYGARFCQAFSDQRSKFSSEGLEWMLKTMQCLQTTLISEATALDGTTCSDLEHKAFASHAPCYVHSGLCKLSEADWLAILEIVHVKTLFRNWDAFKATVQAGEECLEFWTVLVKHHHILEP